MSGWIYTVLDTPGIVQKSQVNSAQECSAWEPVNPELNLLTFPCTQNSDCPYRSTCVAGENGNKFCTRNNVYQYWFYDPSDLSGTNCTKILAGSSVCGVEKPGASGFDIINNVGPSNAICGSSCTTLASCNQTGTGACCPNGWTQKGTTAECIDSGGLTKCCLNDPTNLNYSDCRLKAGACETVGTWWPSNKAEIIPECDNNVTGRLSINDDTLANYDFHTPCDSRNVSDSCTFSGGGVSYTGVCRLCDTDNERLLCFPRSTCQPVGHGAGAGICITKNLC
jgi:hypothetical protein